MTDMGVNEQRSLSEDMRSALLNLSTRIAEAQGEDEVCGSVVEALHHRAFGFDAVGLFLAGTAVFEPVLRASAGPFGTGDGGGGESVSEMKLPLRVDQSAIGELVVQRSQNHSFTQGDMEILAAAAHQAGMAIARTRLLASERQRVEEQRALLATLADLSGELELDKLLQAVLERAIGLLKVTGGELAIFEERTGDLVIAASHNMETNAVGSRMALGEGAMGRVAETHEPLIIPNYQEWEGRSSQYTQRTVQAVIAIPLLVGQRLVGAIASVHDDPVRAFGEADLRVLNLFAVQAAIAVENARLYSAERERASEQQALLDSLGDLSGELDLPSVLRAVLERAVALLDVTGGELAIYDDATEELVVMASENMGANAVGTRMAIGEGAMGGVAETHEPLIIPRYQEWASRSSQYAQSTVQSVMAAPLLIGNRFVGVIASVHSDPEREFGDADLRRLMLFAPQAAIAIENARLFTAERRRAEDQNALLETMKDLSGELELSKVLQGVLERAVALLDVTGGELATFDESAQDLVVVASHNMSTNAVGTRMRLGEGAMGQVAESHNSLIIPNYQEWEERSEKYTQSTVQSVMATPLLMGTRLVGAIASVHSDPARVFGQEDLRLLELFAPQAAVAIENARLYSVAQRYFEDLVLNNPVAITTVDLDFNIISCNPAFERLFGYDEKEIIGLNLDELVTSEGTLAEAQSYTEEVEAGRMVEGRGKRRCKDGSVVDVEIYAIPVIVNGQRVGMMALYHDITELLAARREAEAANSAKSQFLASMSHELRTPLNAILGYSEMLQEDAVDAGQDDFIPDLEKIHSAGKHLLSLINDVLDLSKIEAGKMELYLETFEIRSMVEDVASTIAPLIQKNGNELRVECPHEVATMHSDLTRIRQVLLNLLSNASKFTDHGTITLKVERHESAPVDSITFVVKDSGIGMTPEQMGRLFQAFSQAEAATSSKYGGTGLGLAISQRFCRMMGGDIEVESTAGEGTSFSVQLPAALAVPVPEIATSDDPDGGEVGTVLVIDDDPDARQLVRRHLTRNGFRVVEAADGEAGLALARSERPDAITLDVIMPSIDGWAVLTALKADPNISMIPVIMLTVADDRSIGFALGASEYLTKPIDRDRLVAAVKRFACNGEPVALVIEDDPATRGLLRRTLEQAGWNVAEARHGKDGLARLSERPPELVLLDLMMPEMDGFEFLEAMRARDAWRHVPVVVITAKDLTDDDRRRLNGGVDRIVEKGGQVFEKLVEELREIVPGTRVRQPVGKAP
ncbi:MAG: GAF domain-containing protein [Gemmatimonadetes bacterium]|nr:GAF domain-containing protein [Gemmatimonadota bacterium]